jgi:putative SOS response-associated peptidase YedK
VHSCTILTTQPNALVRELHDRMPVILQPDHEAAWLDAALDVPALEALLVPVEAGELFARPVSLDVNRTRNDSAGLIEPSDDPQLGFL